MGPAPIVMIQVVPNDMLYCYYQRFTNQTTLEFILSAHSTQDIVSCSKLHTGLDSPNLRTFMTPTTPTH